VGNVPKITETIRKGTEIIQRKLVCQDLLQKATDIRGQHEKKATKTTDTTKMMKVGDERRGRWENNKMFVKLENNRLNNNKQRNKAGRTSIKKISDRAHGS
jgi:hypothetical protein